MKTLNSIDPDILINHKLASKESLTLLNRYHLIECYFKVVFFGLIFNAFIPLIAAAFKFCAEGRCDIAALTILGRSPDHDTCWCVAALLGAASMLKVFQLAREQFDGVIGFVTSLILCCGLEVQWLLFAPSKHFGVFPFFDLLVSGAVFLFIVAANAFSGASTLAIRERESELWFNRTLNANLATRAAVLEAREEVRRNYDAALDEVLQKGTSGNSKMNLKVFRVGSGEQVEYWLGPDGDDLQARLGDPNLHDGLTAPRPKVSQDQSQSSPKRSTPRPKSATSPTPVSQNGTIEDGDHSNNGTGQANETPTATAINGAKNGKNRR